MTEDLVYHYTNTAGLLGIIQGRKLWASDIQFLNDAMEINYGVSVIMDKIRSVRKKEDDNLRKVEDELKRTTRPDPQHPTWHLYATCFCDNGDLLSQWRSYGRDGYAIGFRREWLLGIAEEFDCSKLKRDKKIFDRVCYEGGDTHDVPNLAREMSPKFASCTNPNESRVLMCRVTQMAAMIKHRTFKEEDESRLLLPSYGLPNKLKFRVGALGVVPYREVDFEPNDIVEVRIGPGHSSVERSNSVDHLLESSGLRHVLVKPSESPVRL
jgi:hypothetical protein